MKPKTIDLAIRLLGIPVGLFGLYIIVLSLQGVYQEVTGDIFSMGWKYILVTLVLGLLMGLIVLGLSSIAIYTAIALWKKITPTGVRWLMAFYAFALLGMILNVLEYTPIETENPSRFFNRDSIGSVSIIVCVIVYQITSRWLIARSSLGPEPPRPAARHWVGVFCFFIWVGLSGVIAEWPQGLPRTSNGPNFWMDALSSFGPILFVWLLYKAIVYYQDRRFRRYETSRQHALASV